MTVNKTLRGIIPPMITPLLDIDTLDKQGTENLIEHLIAGGVHGIFILGTTGEAQHLSQKIKRDLIATTCSTVNGRVPVLVGISDSSFVESIHLAKYAASQGASALVATPPFFFSLGQPELIEYYTALADECPLPLYLYNMPSHTKIMIEPDTVLALSKHKNIVGLKDSSANGTYFNKLLNLMQDRPDFALFVGPEEMMASMVLMGANGGVSGGANVYPRIFVDLYRAAEAKDVDEVRRLQDQMLQVGKELFGLGRYASGYIKGIKTALALKGICSDYMGLPFNKFQQGEEKIIATAIKRLDNLFQV